jgi:hypothetical protein
MTINLVNSTRSSLALHQISNAIEIQEKKLNAQISKQKCCTLEKYSKINIVEENNITKNMWWPPLTKTVTKTI